MNLKLLKSLNLRKQIKISKDLTALVHFLKKQYFSFKRKKVIKNYLNQKELNKKLHLGCGNNVLEGWLNADLFSNKNVIYLNITQKMPFLDCTFQYVLAEHTIEHIEYNEAKKMLKEIYRILKKNGVIRIATPSLEKYIGLYQDNINEFQKTVVKTMTDNWIRTGFYKASNYAPAEEDGDKSFFINDIFMNYEHKFIYNESTLVKLLKSVGFEKIQICVPGVSTYYELNKIETHVDQINSYLTLTVEAVKP